MDKKKVLTRIISMSAAAVVLTGAGVGTGTDFLSTMNVSAVVTAGDMNTPKRKTALPLRDISEKVRE